ncbi:DUF6678 family protein [Gimesia aquarii]|uniref:Uncharacterized protein n=1 Tax=Gimesia aquarii TaxID=2527964 RepID=A0A517WP36_9PLAN|nr:DUF6678 family protein [Gimesia aquarii]QDU07024.1 hypothetical protein V202x_03690 [Gimesia aquarii]
MQSVMNNTKWRELQMAMYGIKDFCPRWRTRCLENGYLASWDGEWFYHFSEQGYDWIEWVEIKTENAEEDSIVLSELKRIHVPGHRTEHGFKVYGYVKEGQPVNYL